jgi:hypothetical protein
LGFFLEEYEKLEFRILKPKRSWLCHQFSLAIQMVIETKHWVTRMWMRTMYNKIAGHTKFTILRRSYYKKCVYVLNKSHSVVAALSFQIKKRTFRRKTFTIPSFFERFKMTILNT